MRAGESRSTRPGRLRRRLDTIAVGALMSMLVFVVERRLRKAVRRSGRQGDWRPTVQVR
jgi:hypothetical protein